MSDSHSFHPCVAPAKAGTQMAVAAHDAIFVWIPAFAGMTGARVARQGQQ